MDKQQTAKEDSERLIDRVSRHGCGSVVCDVCDLDLETCLAPLPLPATPRLRPALADTAQTRREALARAWEERFTTAMSAY